MAKYKMCTVDNIHIEALARISMEKVIKCVHASIRKHNDFAAD